MINIYVGCSLLHAPEEFRKNINLLKEKLRKEYAVTEFIGLGKGTAQEVFTHDTQCVKDCDLFLAECSYPSTGLGIEIGIALSLNKPILAVALETANVSRMVQGITAENFSYHTYTNISEVVPLVREKTKGLK